MPSSVTHKLFSDDVFNKLDKKTKNSILNSINEYNVFAQGPDPYFFYDFHLTRRSKEIGKINTAMQHSLINKHFSSLINSINQKGYYSNSMVMAYLYGQICHFVLDSVCHPYIVYNTGKFYPDDKDTFKYNGLHEEMEYYIDCYLIYKRLNIKPKDYKTYIELFPKMKFNNEIKDVIDTVSYEVYGFKDVSLKYLKSIKDMKKFYYVFNYDKYGIKKFVYSIMDLLCSKKIIRKKELSFHINPLEKVYYLNNEKDNWCHPCVKDEIYNYSFLELYDMAIDKAVNIISIIDKMLSDKKIDNNKIEKLFGNADYGTGKDCDLNYDFKFFKF